jgi:hypothetical protein
LFNSYGINSSMDNKNISRESWFPDISYHWAKSTLPFAYAEACVEVAIKSSEKAREIYEKIVEVWSKKAIHVTGDKIYRKIPGSEVRRLKEAVIHPEIGLYPDPDKPFAQLEEIFREFSNEKKIRKVYKKIVPKNKKDFQEIYESAKLICDFIIFGFNSESDIQHDKCKVLPDFDYSWLILAIEMRSLFEYYNITMEKLKRMYKVNKYKGKVIDFEQLKVEQPTNRLYRRVIANSKALKLKLKNTRTILNAAHAWYQCRVVHGSVNKYCDAMSLKGIILDPKNVDKQIRPCDEAVGYQGRRKKKI